MAAVVTVKRIAGGALRSGGIEELEGVGSSDPLWVDVSHADATSLSSLARAFSLDDAALHRALHPNGHARLDIRENALQVDWVAVGGFGENCVTKHGFGCVLSGNRLLTFHRADIRLIEEVSAEADPLLAQGVERVLYRVLDGAVDGLLERTAEIETALDAIADSLVEPPSESNRQRRSRLGDVKDAPRRIQQERRRLLDLRRVVVPERDALRRMLRHDTLSEDGYRRLQDVADALTRVEEDIENSRDVATNITDMYLSAVSNNLNLVMKRLTIVATVFMPGTLIVGIYGTNFRYIPELGWGFGYPFMWLLILGVTGGMLAFFRWRRWL